MLMPSIFGESLLDDWFGTPERVFWPDTREMDRTERKLYGRRAGRMMKTDVHEHEDHYEVDMDLPGFRKEEIKLELENGYLTVSAEKEHEEEQANKGKAIRKERYTGSMQRTFYVGEGLTEEDIKAKFEHGVLSLMVPKQEKAKLPEKKTIMIEG